MKIWYCCRKYNHKEITAAAAVCQINGFLSIRQHCLHPIMNGFAVLAVWLLILFPPQSTFCYWWFSSRAVSSALRPDSFHAYILVLLRKFLPLFTFLPVRYTDPRSSGTYWQCPSGSLHQRILRRLHPVLPCIHLFAANQICPLLPFLIHWFYDLTEEQHTCTPEGGNQTRYKIQRASGFALSSYLADWIPASRIQSVSRSVTILTFIRIFINQNFTRWYGQQNSGRSGTAADNQIQLGFSCCNHLIKIDFTEAYPGLRIDAPRRYPFILPVRIIRSVLNHDRYSGILAFFDHRIRHLYPPNKSASRSTF